MATLTARFGVLAQSDFHAFAGIVQSHSLVLTGETSGRLDARVSKPVQAVFDGTSLAPATGPFPGFFAHLSDPIGEMVFSGGIEPALRKSFFAVLEFDAGIDIAGTGGGSGGGSFTGDGFSVVLGDPAVSGDGAWGGAVEFTNDMPVSEAVDRLNETLGLLVPPAPPTFPTGTLSIGSTGATPRLASGVADNAGAALAAGSSVTRVTGVAATNTIQDSGPGKTGTITGYLNGVSAGAAVLTGAGDNGTYGIVVISDQKDSPADRPGFWKTIDVSLSGINAPVGVNDVRIDHDAAAATNTVVFVRDDYTAGPGIAGLAAALSAGATTVYSSGVQHFSAATFDITGDVSGLGGKTYYGGSDVVQVSGQNGIIAAQNFGYGDLGIAVPLAADDQAAKSFSVAASINGSTHNKGRLSARSRNVNATSSSILVGSTLLVMRGSGAGRFVETNIPVSGLGAGSNASRVSTAAGDKPAAAVTAFVPSASLPTHEAAVVAGVLAHDRTNYSAGHLPVGPDLSVGRDGAQYATFSFNRAARSNFVINLTGSYAGLWVRLPGVSDQQPNSPEGWWDMFEPYDGAGVPGETGDPAAGCADGTVASGGSGSFIATFGTQSSSNAVANEIQVRVRLNVGQSLTALSFSG